MSKKEELKDRIDELSSKAWTMMGEEKGARLHELIMLYDQLLELESDPYFIYENKARIHEHLKEYEKAVVCIQKMIDISPRSTLAWWLLANVQFEARKYPEALQAFDTCISFDFASDFRYDLRAKINNALGNHKEAEADQKIYDDYQAAEQAKWDDPNHYYHYK